MKRIKKFKEFLNENKEFKTPVIAAFYQGKLLILKRGSTAPWMPNKWSLVGGSVDAGETPEEAAYRECVEETGLKPKQLTYQYEKQTKSIGIIYYFTAKLSTNKIVLDYENSEYAFISKSDIKKFDFVPHVEDFILSVLT